VPGAGRQTNVRLARNGPQAGVLGAATVAAQEWAAERAKSPV
jgi:glucokinase